jgi:dienelactone hydrolase
MSTTGPTPGTAEVPRRVLLSAVLLGCAAGASCSSPARRPVPRTVRWRDGDVHLAGSWVEAERATGVVVVVCPGARGDRPAAAPVQQRLATARYSSLALTGLPPATVASRRAAAGDPVEAVLAPEERHALGVTRRFLSRTHALAAGRPVALLGLGHGGAPGWALVAEEHRELSAAVFVSSPLPRGLRFGSPRTTPVLACYAQADRILMASYEEAHLALARAAVVHDMVIYGEVDHGFFDEASPDHHADTAEDTARRSVDWFGRHSR